MKRYLFAVAYFVILGLSVATLLIAIPLLIMNIIGGAFDLSDIFRSVVLIPVVAVAGGGMLGGIPAALTGLCTEFYCRIFSSNFILFIAASLVTALFFEVSYCYYLHFKEDVIKVLVASTTITTLILSTYWYRYSKSEYKN